MKTATAKKLATPPPLNGHPVQPKRKAATKTAKAAAKNGHKPKAKKAEPTPEEVFLKAWHLIYDNYHKGNRLD